jgi:hypothetical protein
MKKQVWIRQELFDEAKQRCAVLEAENAALKNKELSKTANYMATVRIPHRAV